MGVGAPLHERQRESGALLTLYKKAVEGGAVATRELGKGVTEAVGEKILLLCHRWRGVLKDFVGRTGGDRPGDHLRV